MLPTGQDVETLRHRVHEGMGADTLRGLASYFSSLQACRWQ